MKAVQIHAFGGPEVVTDEEVPKPAPGPIRLSLDVSPELNNALEQLASKLHTTKSDVLRKAIALMEVAVRAKEEQKKFGIAASGQPLETEIVGL